MTKTLVGRILAMRPGRCAQRAWESHISSFSAEQNEQADRVIMQINDAVRAFAIDIEALRRTQPAADGPNLSADLSHIPADLSDLPRELPFHGHTLKLKAIGLWPRALVSAISRSAKEQYCVLYECERFLNCSDRAPALAFHDRLVGMMLIDRVPPEQLPDILRAQLRRMYWQLEHHIAAEARLGCSIRPADI